MNEVNHSIKCDVRLCRHNENGCNCKLEQIKVTTDCTDCTCCDSFDAKQEQ